MVKFIHASEGAKLVNKGDSIGTSGFLGIGAPICLINELAKLGTGELTLVQAVSAFPGKEHDVGILAQNKQLKKFIGSHIGTSKEISRQFLAGELEVDFIPMGTITEMIRAGGAGLGAVVTPVGVGTQQEEDHEKITRNGKEYLVYDPITLDIAFIKGNKADKYGNLYVHGTSKSITKELALASTTVVAEVDEIVEVGDIDPSDVHVPGILIDYVVQGLTEEERYKYYGDLWEEANMLMKGGSSDGQ